MKALRISACAGGIHVRALPLPAVYRKGDIPAELFRRQASGEIPKAEQNLAAAAFMRTIIVPNGRFTGLASDAGAELGAARGAVAGPVSGAVSGGAPGVASGGLLTFVVSGALSLPGGATNLVPGDLFLVDAASASRVVPTARDNCQLIQISVAPDWPGPDAKLQVPGTLTPRPGKPNIKRVYQGADERAYFSEFPELFPAPPGQWSAPRAAAGFRFMCWEDGFIDWHPEVINNLAIFLSGELELETGGGNGAIEVFHAGDVCLAQDRTGEGHIDRTRGVTHVALIVIETEHLW